MLGYSRHTELLKQALYGYSGNALTTSTAYAPDCGGIMIVVLADVQTLFQRMLQKGAESLGWDPFFSCAVHSEGRIVPESFTEPENHDLLQIASDIILLQILEAKWQLKALMLNFLAKSMFAYQECYDRPIFTRKTHKACAQEV